MEIKFIKTKLILYINLQNKSKSYLLLENNHTILTFSFRLN